MTSTDRPAGNVSYSDAGRLLERAVGDPELCRWCFGRRRRYHPEHDAAEAENLRWGNTKGTLEAKGHRIQEDGTLLVNTATSDPDPSTYQEVVPPTRINGEWYPPRPHTICKCGVIDYSDHDHRSLIQLHDCVDNLADWLERRQDQEAEFHRRAAHNITTCLRQYDVLAGKDEIVLTEALRRGLFCPVSAGWLSKPSWMRPIISSGRFWSAI